MANLVRDPPVQCLRLVPTCLSLVRSAIGALFQRGLTVGGMVPLDSHDHTGNTKSGGDYHNYMKTQRNEKWTLRVGKPIIHNASFSNSKQEHQFKTNHGLISEKNSKLRKFMTKSKPASTWRIIPFSKRLVTAIWKLFMPFGRGPPTRSLPDLGITGALKLARKPFTRWRNWDDKDVTLGLWGPPWRKALFAFRFGLSPTPMRRKIQRRNCWSNVSWVWVHKSQGHPSQGQWTPIARYVLGLSPVSQRPWRLQRPWKSKPSLHEWFLQVVTKLTLSPLRPVARWSFPLLFEAKGLPS